MPRFKKPRRTFRSRRATSRPRGEARLIRGIRPRVNGFPNTIITKLRYSDSLVLGAALGARAVNVFAANGTFDPDITGVGHQPLYRDNYAAIYDQYVVLGSKIIVTYCPQTSNVPTLCGIVGDDDTSISATVTTLMEQNNSVTKLAGLPGSETVTLSQTFSGMSGFGVAVKDDGASSTSVSANPSELWAFGVWVAAADGSSTTTVQVRIQIEYTVKFSELITPVAS